MMTVMIVGLFIAVLGLLCGSFVNALVWRVHEQASAKAKVKRDSKAAKLPTAADLSILHGRSMCPHCHHTLAAKYLVPVLSWLSLRGKCRYCRAPISVQYPAVELLTAGLFGLSYVAWPWPLTGTYAALLAVFLGMLVLYMALAVYDIRWFLLPNRLVRPLTLLGVIYAVVAIIARSDGQSPTTLIFQTLLGVSVLYGLFWALHTYSKGTWIGGGDVNIAAALGLVAGSGLQAALLLFVASLLGTLGSIPLLVKGKSGLKRHIPFGPYLLAASVVVTLFGQRLINWYLTTLIQ